MQPKLSKRKNIIRLAITYAGMIIVIILVVLFIFMFMLGYRFDKNNGQLEQYALLQFNSSPSSATVTVDGSAISSQTPNKVSVPAGNHSLVIKRLNYQDWKKNINVKSATMTWFNYAILVPNKLNVEQITKYESIYASLSSPTKLNTIIQEKAEVPSFDLVNLSSDSPKSTKIAIPAKSYSDATTSGIVHSFNPVKWDEGGRYVLIKHIYGDKSEWLVMDTQDVNLTKNITQLLNVAINDIYFSGTNGNDYYALISNDIRKLNLSEGTISKPFVSNVSSFSLYEANIITYIGTGDASKNEQVVGVYREGDSTSHILRKVTSKDTSLRVATAHYFNEDYVAIAEGKKVDILRGSYPNGTDSAASLKIIDSFESKQAIHSLIFSPTGEYIVVQSDAYFTSYDLEYQKMYESTIDGNGPVSDIKWLDNNYIWSDRDGHLTIREFDGTNMHKINSVVYGQDVVMTHNKRFIYSINKTATGYQLQRVRMILL